MEHKYNLKSPAVKRLMKEAVELREPTEHYHAQPLEDNLFEWHFSVRGPPDSDFDGGIILLTPNGRFEVGKKICLSISGHHPETWQPSWSIRTALLAIIGFMPTKGEGAIGSLDYTPEERRALAKKSQDFCCETCSCSMRSVLLSLSANSSRSAEVQKAQQLAQQISFKVQSSGDDPPAPTLSDLPEPLTSPPEAGSSPPESETSPPVSVDPSIATPERPLSPRQRRQQQQSRQAQREPSRAAFTAPRQAADTHAGSAVLIVLLTLALAALIFRRIYLAQDYRLDLDL
uniref:Ubiquitin-conjugating enzyme E2, J1 n=1 Tax=Neogobius melanostomus TaxID=47308 RepID=A0A8C6SBV7_9GOBI